jgi:hypothetical protein
MRQGAGRKGGGGGGRGAKCGAECGAEEEVGVVSVRVCERDRGWGVRDVC